jgi:hypothetical protein
MHISSTNLIKLHYFLKNIFVFEKNIRIDTYLTNSKDHYSGLS